MLKIQTMSNHNYEILIWHKMMQSYQFLSQKLLDMSGHVWCEFIRFYKHVKTCLEILKPPNDANWCNSTNMSRLVIMLWCNLMWFYTSQTCLDLSKTKRWRKLSKWYMKCLHWQQSYSLDRFEQVERSKIDLRRPKIQKI